MSINRNRPALVAVGLSLAFGAHAASMFDFDVWMRAIDNRSVSVQKHIAARNHDAAIADARELERLYERMERYFERDYPAEDATKISREGKLLAASIPGAMQRTAYEEAALAARDIARACNDCHDPYKPFPK
jgi:hypothetical protein